MDLRADVSEVRRVDAPLIRRPSDDKRMADNTSETRHRTGQVPGDAYLEPRADNEPLDEHESTFMTRAAVLGMLGGGLAGACLGLIAAAFPAINWWTGLMIGAIVGLIAAGL